MGRSVTELYEKEREAASLTEIVLDREGRISKLQKNALFDLVIIGLDGAGLALAYQASFTGLRVLIVGESDIGEPERAEIQFSPVARISRIFSYIFATRTIRSQVPKFNPDSIKALLNNDGVTQLKFFRLLALAINEEGCLLINYLKPLEISSMLGAQGFKIRFEDLISGRKLETSTGIIVTSKQATTSPYSITWNHEQPGRISVSASNVVDSYVMSKNLLKQIIAKTNLDSKPPELYSRLLPNQTDDQTFITRLIRQGLDEQQAIRTQALLGSRAKWFGEDPTDWEMHEVGVMRGVVRIVTATELVTSEKDLLRRLE